MVRILPESENLFIARRRSRRREKYRRPFGSSRRAKRWRQIYVRVVLSYLCLDGEIGFMFERCLALVLAPSPIRSC